MVRFPYTNEIRALVPSSRRQIIRQSDSYTFAPLHKSPPGWMKAALAWSLALLSCADSLAPTLSPRVRPVPVDNVPPSPKPEIKSKYSAPPPPPPPLFLQRPTKSELNAPLAQEITFESSIDTLRPKSLAIFIGYHSRRNRGGLVACEFISIKPSLRKFAQTNILPFYRFKQWRSKPLSIFLPSSPCRLFSSSGLSSN